MVRTRVPAGLDSCTSLAVAADRVVSLDASSWERLDWDWDSHCEVEEEVLRAADMHKTGSGNTFAFEGCNARSFPVEPPYMDR